MAGPRASSGIGHCPTLFKAPLLGAAATMTPAANSLMVAAFFCSEVTSEPSVLQYGLKARTRPADYWNVRPYPPHQALTVSCVPQAPTDSSVTAFCRS
jgi:hypothetical protein